MSTATGQRVDLSPLEAPILKPVNDFYTWKAADEAIKLDESSWDVFAVDRPSGSPYLCWMLGETLTVDPLGESCPPDTKLSDRLVSLSKHVRRIFGDALVGEILWFYDEGTENLVFAAFSPYLAGAALMPSFESEARDFLAGYMQ